MQNLLTITEQDLIAGTPSIDIANFRNREAARAVLLDKDKRIYLMNVGKYEYHKLPGGGIDEGEEIIQALERELMEEVGCRAKVLAEIGTVIEYRSYDMLKQISYCFLAQQKGDQMEPALEESELAGGLTEVKATNINEAVALLKSDKPKSLEGAYIQRRDLAFLEAAKLHIDRM